MQTVKNILSALGRFVAWFLPFAKNKAEIVAPEIQKQIDQILGSAKQRVAELKANHSVASIQQQMEDDIKAVRETAEHHVSLIQSLARSKIIEANKVLPDVASQLGAAAVSAALTPPTPPANPSTPPSPAA